VKAALALVKYKQS